MPNRLEASVNITTVLPTGKMPTETTAAFITLTSTPVRWDTWYKPEITPKYNVMQR